LGKNTFFFGMSLLCPYIFFGILGVSLVLEEKKILMSIRKYSVFCAALPRGRQGSTSAVWWQWHSRYSLPDKHS